MAHFNASTTIPHVNIFQPETTTQLDLAHFKYSVNKTRPILLPFSKKGAQQHYSRNTLIAIRMASSQRSSNSACERHWTPARPLFLFMRARVDEQLLKRPQSRRRGMESTQHLFLLFDHIVEQVRRL